MNTDVETKSTTTPPTEDTFDPPPSKKTKTPLLASLVKVCACCTRPPKQPPYHIDIESHQWRPVAGLFSPVPSAAATKATKRKKTRHTTTSSPYAYATFVAQVNDNKHTRRKELRNMATHKNTKIDLLLSRSIVVRTPLTSHIELDHDHLTPYVSVERFFYPSNSERHQLANITNPSITLKFRFKELLSSAIDETIWIEWGRQAKQKKRWFAKKAWTDLFRNGKKEPGLIMSSATATSFPFIQTLSSVDDQGGTKTVVMSLVTYKGHDMNTFVPPLFFGTHIYLKGYQVGRVFHLFHGHIQDVEDAILAEQQHKCVAILNEQTKQFFVRSEDKTLNSGKESRKGKGRTEGKGSREGKEEDDGEDEEEGRAKQSMVRRGIALMLLRRLGLETFGDC
jgi:hypothetical protein